MSDFLPYCIISISPSPSLTMKLTGFATPDRLHPATRSTHLMCFSRSSNGSTFMKSSMYNFTRADLPLRKQWKWHKVMQNSDRVTLRCGPLMLLVQWKVYYKRSLSYLVRTLVSCLQRISIEWIGLVLRQNEINGWLMEGSIWIRASFDAICKGYN